MAKETTSQEVPFDSKADTAGVKAPAVYSAKCDCFMNGVYYRKGDLYRGSDVPPEHSFSSQQITEDQYVPAWLKKEFERNKPKPPDAI